MSKRFQPGDRVVHISGREGTVRERLEGSQTPKHYVRVHWDGNPDGHTASIPPDKLARLGSSPR